MVINRKSTANFHLRWIFLSYSIVCDFFVKDTTLCVIAIFLGGAAECTMAQWSSGYIEEVFGIPKVSGDIFGVALFALMLGIGRTMYSKIGKHIERVLLVGAVGAFVCYLVAALSDIPFVGLFACAFTGLCVSMLWPGSLIVVADKFPKGGVFIYAMMAAGGDLGASVGPQIIGLVADYAVENDSLIAMSQTMSISPEQLGLKLGMLIGSLFPLLAVGVYFYFWQIKRKKS